MHLAWRRKWHPTPVLLPGKSHGQRGLVGCSPWVANSRTQLSDFTFTFHFHALEKEMATHSSVLAWRIPGMGEPGGLPSLGLHSVGHDWGDLAAAAAACMHLAYDRGQKCTHNSFINKWLFLKTSLFGLSCLSPVKNEHRVQKYIQKQYNSDDDNQQ